MNKQTNKHKTKQLIILLLLPIVFVSAITSCRKANEESFSCNPEINKWVKTYKSSLQDISRDQIAMLPVRYQRPVFRSLSGEKKLSLWQQKLELVLQEDWDFSTRAKIVELLEKLNLNLYNKPISEPPSTEWQNYLDEWEHDMLGNNRIDSVQFIIHFCTLMTFDEVDKLLNHPETIDRSWLEGYT